MSLWVMARLSGMTVGVQLVGLLHDAAEAYFRDLPRPIKHDPSMSFYREREENLKRLIFRWAGVLDDYMEFANIIKAVDAVALATERRDLMAPCRFRWGSIADVDAHDDKIVPSVSAVVSRMAFKYHFTRLRIAVEDRKGA